MRKDRNCGGINYSQAVPIMGMPQPMMIPQPYAQSTYVQSQPDSYNLEQQINNLRQRLNSLESRVSKLEGASTSTTTNNYSNKYNDSNYYML